MLLDDTTNRASEAFGSSQAEGSFALEDVRQADQEIYNDEYASVDTQYKRQQTIQKAKEAGSKIKKQKEEKQPTGATKPKLTPSKNKLKEAARKASEQYSQFGSKEDQVRERVKEEARQKAKQFSKKLANKATGATKTAEKGAQLAKGAKTAATAVRGAEGVIAAAGVATAETGIGPIIAFFLEMAISLGISDAVDGAFELKAGNTAKARSLFIKAAMKVAMFINILVTIMLLVTVIGGIVGIPLLIILNIYMFLGFVFKDIAILQGIVWWESLLLLIVDIFTIIILGAFILSIGWYVCDQTGIGGRGVVGTVAPVIAKVIDWWTGSEYASTVNEMCTAINGTGTAGTAPPAATSTSP